MIIEVPKEVKFEIKGNTVTFSGSQGSNSRAFNDVLLSVKSKENAIEVLPVQGTALSGRAAKAANAFAKELRNDSMGVVKHFERHMVIVFAHFPMTVEVKDRTFMIKNMLGERAPRTANIVGDTKIEVKGQNVRVYGSKLDDVAQTAANIRNATKTRKLDIRIFQDGIYYAVEKR